jgi:hypothetical protein
MNLYLIRYINSEDSLCRMEVEGESVEAAKKSLESWLREEVSLFWAQEITKE